MRKLLLLAWVLGLTLLTGACANSGYQRDPAAEACNVGGPLGKLERSIAMEPNPQGVPGRPAECRVGSDGVLRMPAR